MLPVSVANPTPSSNPTPLSMNDKLHSGSAGVAVVRVSSIMHASLSAKSVAPLILKSIPAQSFPYTAPKSTQHQVPVASNTQKIVSSAKVVARAAYHSMKPSASMHLIQCMFRPNRLLNVCVALLALSAIFNGPLCTVQTLLTSVVSFICLVAWIHFEDKVKTWFSSSNIGKYFVSVINTDYALQVAVGLVFVLIEAYTTDISQKMFVFCCVTSVNLLFRIMRYFYYNKYFDKGAVCAFSVSLCIHLIVCAIQVMFLAKFDHGWMMNVFNAIVYIFMHFTQEKKQHNVVKLMFNWMYKQFEYFLTWSAFKVSFISMHASLFGCIIFRYATIKNVCMLTEKNATNNCTLTGVNATNNCTLTNEDAANICTMAQKNTANVCTLAVIVCFYVILMFSAFMMSREKRHLPPSTTQTGCGDIIWNFSAFCVANLLCWGQQVLVFFLARSVDMKDLVIWASGVLAENVKSMLPNILSVCRQLNSIGVTIYCLPIPLLALVIVSFIGACRGSGFWSFISSQVLSCSFHIISHFLMPSSIGEIMSMPNAVMSNTASIEVASFFSNTKKLYGTYANFTTASNDYFACAGKMHHTGLHGICALRGSLFEHDKCVLLLKAVNGSICPSICNNTTHLQRVVALCHVCDDLLVKMHENGIVMDAHFNKMGLSIGALNTIGKWVACSLNFKSEKQKEMCNGVNASGHLATFDESIDHVVGLMKYGTDYTVTMSDIVASGMLRLSHEHDTKVVDLQMNEELVRLQTRQLLETEERLARVQLEQKQANEAAAAAARKLAQQEAEAARVAKALNEERIRKEAEAETVRQAAAQELIRLAKEAKLATEENDRNATQAALLAAEKRAEQIRADNEHKMMEQARLVEEQQRKEQAAKEEEMIAKAAQEARSAEAAKSLEDTFAAIPVKDSEISVPAESHINIHAVFSVIADFGNTVWEDFKAGDPFKAAAEFSNMDKHADGQINTFGDFASSLWKELAPNVTFFG